VLNFISNIRGTLTINVLYFQLIYSKNKPLPKQFLGCAVELKLHEELKSAVDS